MAGYDGLGRAVNSLSLLADIQQEFLTRHLKPQKSDTVIFQVKKVVCGMKLPRAISGFSSDLSNRMTHAHDH